MNRLCSDTAITFAVLSAGKIHFTNKITFAYRQREGSMSHKPNKLELNMMELMLFQDCLCSGRMKWSSRSRYYPPLRFVCTNRRELQNASYAKYFKSCGEYDNNVLGAILNYDTDMKSRRFIRRLTVKGKLAGLFFKYAGKFYRLPFRIIRKCKRIFLRS